MAKVINRWVCYRKKIKMEIEEIMEETRILFRLQEKSE